MNVTSKKIPLRKGLWMESENLEASPRLVASRCLACGEIFFPKREGSLCTYCQSNKFEEIQLSSQGKIYSYTVIMQRPPFYYRGKVPYAIGYVELPEGVRVETIFTDCDFDELRIGMEAELVLRSLHQDDEGNDVVTYMFRPMIKAA